MTAHDAYYEPSHEKVQCSEEICIEFDAARTISEPDSSLQPESQLPPESTVHVDVWPAEFKRPRNLNLAMENRPCIEVAEESRHLRDMISEFMQDPKGYGGSDPRADQVRDFCLGTCLGAVRDQQEASYVAWLDERSFENGQCCPRPYQGPLTARELYAQLRKPVGHLFLDPISHGMSLTSLGVAISTSVISGNGTPRESIENGCSDEYKTSTHEISSAFQAHKRHGKSQRDKKSKASKFIRFITDLDPKSIYALISTVSKTQAAPLRDAIYKHLAFQAHFEASFSLGGFHGFPLVFHLPYFPLDDHRWIAYCFVDTYFDGEDEWRESVVEYRRDRESEYGFNADPLTYGNVDADMPILDPRGYFLRVLEHRLYQVWREWLTVIDKIKEHLQRQDHLEFHLGTSIQQLELLQLQLNIGSRKVDEDVGHFSWLIMVYVSLVAIATSVFSMDPVVIPFIQRSFGSFLAVILVLSFTGLVVHSLVFWDK
ncbi:uncharacterized protein Z519_08701 [Cladophialophora bantiana CBS 173.52]|uniref:Uncharacterized protein n=1 Tax=Cladophialophora bantiana (strain ATCC 10958 / CBS 173.52 / CDC B-1940 / NIH 8579) TaxID=1442370 RepID=A0A0D2HCA9_CLAB1|nr:uncharacterized protein Z519_08701 [Cladophialophora bantiana CBS 173.52]KIW90918.1 hypothetical protein Z519_08701 [Cladophialophora bantiana CBS 173.52]